MVEGCIVYRESEGESGRWEYGWGLGEGILRRRVRPLC